MTHLGTRRPATAAIVVLLVALSAMLGLSAPATAQDVPYTDDQAVGSVGLCDMSGRPITHGNVNDKPFVWRAVSSVAATAPFDGTGRKATLYAYQPRKKTSAVLWSGEKMTSSSLYTNVRYPMAQSTLADRKLANFLNDFPPQWDGLVQLRIYLSAPGQQPDPAASYPATDLRITGDTWTVVRGASVPCTQGSAKDTEILTPAQRRGLTGSATVAPGATRPATVPAGSSGAAASGSGSGTAPSPGASTGDLSRTSAAARTTEARKSDDSGVPTVVVLLLVAAVVVLGGAGLVLRRRRS